MSDKSNIYNLVNDGSSDTGLKKMNVACTMIFDINRSKTVEMSYFDMCSTTWEDASKASTLFTAINDAMKKRHVDWSNCVSIGVDNTNSNVGRHNSLSSRILQCNKSTHIDGCSCHLAHLAASKGGAAFTDVSGFNMEQRHVDLYYYFKGSTRRKGILLVYIYFVGLEWDGIARFVPTRWLCLERCCQKETEKFEDLVSMFQSRTDESSKQDGGNENDDKKLLQLDLGASKTTTKTLSRTFIFNFMYLLYLLLPILICFCNVVIHKDIMSSQW